MNIQFDKVNLGGFTLSRCRLCRALLEYSPMERRKHRAYHERVFIVAAREGDPDWEPHEVAQPKPARQPYVGVDIDLEDDVYPQAQVDADLATDDILTPDTYESKA